MGALFSAPELPPAPPAPPPPPDASSLMVQQSALAQAQRMSAIGYKGSFRAGARGEGAVGMQAGTTPANTGGGPGPLKPGDSGPAKPRPEDTDPRNPGGPPRRPGEERPGGPTGPGNRQPGKPPLPEPEQGTGFTGGTRPPPPEPVERPPGPNGATTGRLPRIPLTPEQAAERRRRTLLGA